MAGENNIRAIRFLGWYFLRVAVGDLDKTKPLQWEGGINGSSKVEIVLTGDRGELTEEQIAQVENDNNIIEIVCDGLVYRLENKDSSLSYRTYVAIDCATSLTATVKALYIQLNKSALNYGHWSIEQKTTTETTSPTE